MSPEKEARLAEARARFETANEEMADGMKRGVPWQMYQSRVMAAQAAYHAALWSEPEQVEALDWSAPNGTLVQLPDGTLRLKVSDVSWVGPPSYG